MGTTELTLDISTLWRIFKKHAFIIIVFTVIATVTAFIISSFIIQKQYSATAKLYVENKSAEQSSQILNSSELNAARSVVNTCIQLFITRDLAQELSDSTGNKYSSGELMGMISMQALNNTEFLQITMTMDNPQEAVNTLKVFVDLCISKYNDVVSAGKIMPVDSPASSNSPVYPNVNMFTAAGFFIGFLGTFIIVFIVEVLDTKVKAEDDLFKIYDIPVFAEILNFDARVKGDYGYEYK